MHVLIATAGALPSTRVADLVSRLNAGEAGMVTVMSVIEVPRGFLDELDEPEWLPFDHGDDGADDREALVGKYVEERGSKLVEPVVAALKVRGLDSNVLLREGTDAAQTIVETAAAEAADLIVVGATRPIFDESVWNSVSVQVMQRSPVPVVLIPGVSRTLDDVERDERRRAIDQQVS